MICVRREEIWPGPERFGRSMSYRDAMATKIVCQECGAEFESRDELEEIVVNSAVRKTRRICPECGDTSGTFDTVQVN